jgi:phage terminase large subunit-like protein
MTTLAELRDSACQLLKALLCKVSRFVNSTALASSALHAKFLSKLARNYELVSATRQILDTGEIEDTFGKPLLPTAAR